MKYNKVLVTGGAGFIGASLVGRLIREGAHVRVMDSLTSQIHGEVPRGLDWLSDSAIEFVRGSVTSRSDWDSALEGIDQVVHLASETGTGQSMYEVGRYCEANLMGTALMIDALGAMSSRTVRRVLLSSSRSVYGEGSYECRTCAGVRTNPGSRKAADLRNHNWDPMCTKCGHKLEAVPTRESDILQPSSIYACTKSAQEDLVRIGCDALAIDHAIFRLQNVYGEGQSLKNPYTGILSIFSTRIRRHLDLPIFEDGKESRDFVHVDDVVQAFISGLNSESPVNDVMNVGSGVATSVKHLATELSAAFGEEPRVVVTGQFRIGDIRHNYADIGKIGAQLNFKPTITLDKGLRRFSEWVLQQPLPEDRLDQANRELTERKLMG